MSNETPTPETEITHIPGLAGGRSDLLQTATPKTEATETTPASGADTQEPSK